MKLKKDLSTIALTFFLTRCFFNLYTFTNLFSFFIISGITIFLLFLIKKIKRNIFSNPFLSFFYGICLLLIFLIILINTANFIHMNYFHYNNNFTVILSLLTIAYIIGKDTIKTIASISEILLFVFIVIAVLISLGLISLIQLSNYSNFASLNTISINVLPVLVIIVLFYLKETNITTGYLLGNLSVLFDTLLMIGCLGTKLPTTYSYPGISLLNSITFLGFINHLDKLFSFIYLFEYTITLALILNILKTITKQKILSKK